MKKEIRLMLDYQCFPIWIYQKDGTYIDNDLVEEIRNDKNLCKKLEEIQNIFDSLYLNDQSKFEYVGFKSLDQKDRFMKQVDEVYECLSKLLGDKYTIKNFIDFNIL